MATRAGRSGRVLSKSVVEVSRRASRRLRAGRVLQPAKHRVNRACVGDVCLNQRAAPP